MDMYNCLKTPTSQFRKLLASLFVSAALCAGAWAETYYWVGGATDVNGDPDNNWAIGSNWNTASDGTGTAAPDGGPSTEDTVQLQGNEEITLSGDVSIQFLLIYTGTNSSTLNLA